MKHYVCKSGGYIFAAAALSMTVPVANAHVSTSGPTGATGAAEIVILPDRETKIKGERPSLLVVIAVDQFSADLFSEYRRHFKGGLQKMQSGVVFPLAYQAHATTETCPGHSTILTGAHPARTGIIANDWVAPTLNRADKTVYCVEDETVSGSSSRQYVVSDRHLLVPTLGERVKAAEPRTRVISIAGKDRAAVLLAGRNADEVWWWDGKAFASYPGREPSGLVKKVNIRLASSVAEGARAMELPAACAVRSNAIVLNGNRVLGEGRFARQAGDSAAFRNSPALDKTVLELAADMAEDMQLGTAQHPDLLAVGLSATDFVGHVFGTGGSEMCINLLALDSALAIFFQRLDNMKIDYVAVLTADHGGIDFPERTSSRGLADAVRIGEGLSAEAIGASVASALKLPPPVLYGGKFGDMWINPSLKTEMRNKVQQLSLAKFRSDPSVDSVFTREQILAQDIPNGTPDNWTLLERIRANFNSERSGDFYVALRPRRTPIADPAGPYLAMHGSPWDYDRRVPILFWRKGMASFEQPLAVATVDIVPTLAALINLEIPEQEIDGRCLDLISGDSNNCPK